MSKVTIDRNDVGAEAVAHSVLRLCADFPGVMGRLRIARVVGGFSIPHRDDTPLELLSRYHVSIDWPLREVVALVDALLSGGLVAQTSGARPVVVLTRAGFSALEALERAPATP